MEKGVGYTTIYSSKKNKIELSTNATILRRTLKTDSSQHEYLYMKVTASADIKNIEYKSEKWKVLEGDHNRSYNIMMQLNSENKSTGNIKIVNKTKSKVNGLKDKSVIARQEDFSYYIRYNKKRKG